MCMLCIYYVYIIYILCIIFLQFTRCFCCRVPLSDEAADKFDADNPGLTRKLSKKGSSRKLKCIGKQESDENPLMRRAIARNATPPSSLPTTADDLDKTSNHISPGISLPVIYPWGFVGSSDWR